MIPIAIVDKSVDFNYQSFFEATADNVGMTMKWFTDIESGRAWLKNKTGHQSKT